MMQHKETFRFFGILAGALFLAQAAYQAFVYVTVFRSLGAYFNPLTLLTIAEYVMIGVAALLDRRGKLLEIAAWAMGVQNLLSAVTSLWNVVMGGSTTPVVRQLMLINAVGSIAAVLLAVTLIKAIRANGKKRGLLWLSLAPAAVQLAGVLLQLAQTVEGASLTAASLLFALLRSLGTALVCVWAAAPEWSATAEDAFQPEMW